MDRPALHNEPPPASRLRRRIRNRAIRAAIAGLAARLPLTPREIEAGRLQAAHAGAVPAWKTIVRRRLDWIAADARRQVRRIEALGLQSEFNLVYLQSLELIRLTASPDALRMAQTDPEGSRLKQAMRTLWRDFQSVAAAARPPLAA